MAMAKMIRCEDCPVRGYCSTLAAHVSYNTFRGLDGTKSEPTSISYNGKGSYVPENDSKCPLFKLVNK